MAADDRLYEEAGRCRDEAQAFKDAGNPFDAARIRKLQDRADKLNAHRVKLSASIREYGYMLVDAAVQIDAVTSLAERCDLLNVNVADRAGLTDSDGVVRIIFAHGLEDSAERRHAERNDGPLFNGLRRIMMDFLATPDGNAAGHRLMEATGLFGTTH